MPTLQHTIRMLKTPLLEDGVISLGETSLLLRAVRPFVMKGDATACELRDLLMRVRKDGIITREESQRVCGLMEQITNGTVQFEQYVHVVPDFPHPGLVFRDTTRLLDTPWLFRMVLEMIDEALSDVAFDLIASPSPRGFVFGAAIAARHGAGFVPIRMPGKLPRETVSEEFETRHGKSVLEVHADAVMRGERVVIVDDVLASGTTAAAAARLVRRLGGQVVKMLFPVELPEHKARENALKGMDVYSLVKCSGL